MAPQRAFSVSAAPAGRSFDREAPVAGARAPAAPARAPHIGASGGDALFQRLVMWWVPLWIMGALTLAQIYVLVRLAATRRPIGPGANLVVLCWLGVGLMQAFCVVLAGVRLNVPGKMVAELLGFGVIGWLFGAMAISAGAAHHLHSPRMTRAVAWLGGMALGLALLALVGRMAGLSELYISPAPLGMLFPHSTVARFYATAAVYIREDTLGEKMTRLILFFPWATALGLGGLGIFFISTRDDSLKWRLIGMAGGLAGVLFSWSRIAIATWLAVGAVVAFLRAGTLTRLAVIGAVLLTLFALPLYGIDVFTHLAGLRHSVDSARAGSSMARDLIYQKSWQGFLASPWIGNGWIGDSVHPKEELPIGSHSTIYGLLYTGGLPTFLAFALAMATTLLLLIGRLFQARDDAARARIEVAIALTLCLLAFCPFEQLFSLTVPCLFMFMWIGACLADAPYGAPAEAAATTAPVAPFARAVALRMGRPPAAQAPEPDRALRPQRGGPGRAR
jgi:hypothetical protein